MYAYPFDKLKRGRTDLAINKGFHITSAINGKQRRKKGRIRTNIPGIYIIHNNQKPKNIDCTIVDLGIGGLTIQSGVALYQGEKVTTIFRLEENDYTIEGIICRISGKNAVLKYDELSETVSTRFQEYINKAYYDESA